MSNLELAKRIYEPWSRGDFSDLDWAHPEIVMIAAQGEVSEGIEAVTRAWAEFAVLWEDLTVDAERFVAGRDAVVVLIRFSGSAKASGIPAEHFVGANRLEFRDGRVVRLKLYEDREAALTELEPESLEGTWTLVEWTASNGEKMRHPCGPDAAGRIIYGPSYMSAFLARADGFSEAIAYSGTWERLGEEVIHHVSLSTVEAFAGTDLVRTVTWDGDDLVLTTPPRDGWTNQLRWRRAVA